MIDLGVVKELTDEEKAKENIKQSVLIIEGLCFVLNNATLSLRFAEAALKGFNLLNQMHKNLLDQLGSEEVQKMREAYKTNVPPPGGPNGAA